MSVTELRFNHMKLTRQLTIGRSLAPKREHTGSSLLALLLLFAASLLFATEKSRAQCPLHLPPKCQQIANELNDLVEEKKSLQTDMQKAVGQEKSSIANSIKKLIPQINAKQLEVDKCAAQNGMHDLPAIIKVSKFKPYDIQIGFLGYDDYGRLDKWYYQSPVSMQVPLGLTFLHWVHDQFVVQAPNLLVYDYEFGTDFPKIGPEYPPGESPDTNPHFSSGCGYVDRKTGRMSVSIVLPIHITYRPPDKAYGESAGFANLAITLTTDKVANNFSGTPFDSTGRITLVGEGVFQNWPLKGQRCRLIIGGILSPLP